jgi:hypothetical protein
MILQGAICRQRLGLIVQQTVSGTIPLTRKYQLAPAKYVAVPTALDAEQVPCARTVVAYAQAAT